MTSKPHSSRVRELREFADAVDADRGHAKSYLTTVMRQAADRLERLEEQFKTLHRAATKLNEEMAVEHSGFDSEGVYERYWRYKAEPEFVRALTSAMLDVRGGVDAAGAVEEASSDTVRFGVEIPGVDKGSIPSAPPRSSSIGSSPATKT